MILSLLSFLLFWLACDLASSDNERSKCGAPGFLIQPQPIVYYRVGERVQLTCVASGDPKPIYYWKKYDKRLQINKNDDNIIQSKENGTLVFKEMKFNNAGSYQCLAENNLGVASSHKVNLQEAVLSDFYETEAKTHRPTVGEPYTLICNPPWSVPKASVIWVLKDHAGIKAVSLDARVQVDNYYNLRFSNIQRQDQLALPYACMAFNPYLQEEAMGPLHYIKLNRGISRNPAVTFLWSSPERLIGLEGEPFSAVCIFAGNPTPEVHWKRLDNEMTSLPMKFQYGEMSFSSLRSEDAGDYQCWADDPDSGKKVIKTFKLEVHVKPSITHRPRSIETGKGGMARFHCKAAGTPVPQIKWYINGQRLNNTFKNMKHIKKIDNNTIQIERVEKSHGMIVQCNATNQHGGILASAYLCIVSGAPEIAGPPHSKLNIAKGDAVNVTCRVSSAVPHKGVRWIKDGSLVVESQRMQVLSNGDLNIKSVTERDEGQYSCEARNVYRTLSREVKLVVCERGSCPENEPDTGSQNVYSIGLTFILALMTCFQ